MYESLSERDAPTSSSLYAVASADRMYAAGSDGYVLRRRDGERETVLETGALGDGNAILSLAATDDGEALWAVDESGAVVEGEF